MYSVCFMFFAISLFGCHEKKLKEKDGGRGRVAILEGAFVWVSCCSLCVLCVSALLDLQSLKSGDKRVVCLIIKNIQHLHYQLSLHWIYDHIHVYTMLVITRKSN